MNISDKLMKVKKRVAGCRRVDAFDFTFRQSVSEKYNITDMPRSNKRVMAELEFAIHLSEANGGVYDSAIDNALDFILESIDKDGALTDAACVGAEEMLSSLKDAAKEYEVILISHAHIDMNWQWGYDETVAITLATFRSILNIMNEYPDFTYMQSQASVYKIVEEHDPEMMEEIKARIREGRWEVTANAWVETDKNMPETESLIRHIEYAREYLTKVWDVKRSDIDFSPDTFGHSAHIPEINGFGGVKYYYHCRGNKRPETLYRFRSPSGKEVLAYREPVWYNGAVTEHIGSSAVKISALSGGFKTIPLVYGVGDHGGGPTRRDVERALDMMNWDIYPTLRFGTLHEYFDKAMSMWDKLPVVCEEMNYFSPGCYTTQSRIKRGNRRLECALYNAESMSALGCALTDHKYAKASLTKAWTDVLFNHFHDIITGSCVPESREHAMALFQSANATANTQIQNAMRKIGLQIDTSSIEVDIDAYNSLSEGAGVGYGVHDFIGVPSTERGSGKTRIFHVFNTLPYERKQTVELTVWDWMGDISRLKARDASGAPLDSQTVDSEPQPYWDHRYNRVLVDVNVPALGYTTVVLYEADYDSVPVFLQDDRFMKNRGCTPFDDFVLENAFIKAVVDKNSGRLVSVIDKKTGKEQIKVGEGAGLRYIETECKTSDAWNIGRHISCTPVARCLELVKTLSGDLCTKITAKYDINGSKAEIVYSLDKNSSAVRMDFNINWHEHGIGNDIIPVLDYTVPLAFDTDKFMYDVPAGTVIRDEINHDVPALKFGMAIDGNRGLSLISDCKYGYRAADGALGITLINSSTRPDRYPELGIHKITLWLGVSDSDSTSAKKNAVDCNVPCIYQPSNSHKGTLPMEMSMFSLDSDHAVVTAVKPTESGKLLVRFYESEGKIEPVTVSFGGKVKSARAVDLWGNTMPLDVAVDGERVSVTPDPFTVTALEIEGE